MEEMKRKVEDDRRALSAESEQMHAKMDFQVHPSCLLSVMGLLLRKSLNLMDTRA